MCFDVPTGTAIGGTDFEDLGGEKHEVFATLSELRSLLGFPCCECLRIGMGELLLEFGEVALDLRPVSCFENCVGHHYRARILSAVAVEPDVADRVEVGEELVVILD